MRSQYDVKSKTIHDSSTFHVKRSGVIYYKYFGWNLWISFNSYVCNRILTILFKIIRMSPKINNGLFILINIEGSGLEKNIYLDPTGESNTWTSRSHHLSYQSRLLHLVFIDSKEHPRSWIPLPPVLILFTALKIFLPFSNLINIFNWDFFIIVLW